MARRVIEYRDPVNDDFAENNIRAKPVEADFPFARTGRFWRALSAGLYYGVAAPLVWVISKVYLGMRFENRKVLRPLRKTGFFLYCNHTRNLDAFLPAMAAFPKRAYVIAGADAVSLPGLRHFVLMLGVIPIPTVFSGMRNFLEAVHLRAAQGHCVAVFPEAHIWPFYTGIRPFPDTSFRYPVRENLPAVAAVVTYRRRRGLFRLCRKPGMTVTLSPPMYPDPDLRPRDAQRALRDQSHAFMAKTASEKENIAYIEYIPAK